MKIAPVVPLRTVVGARPAAGVAPASAPGKDARPQGLDPGPAVVTELSETARAMLSRPAAVRAEADTGPESLRVRPGVVAAIRAELDAGTFGGAADVERTIDALLRRA